MPRLLRRVAVLLVAAAMLIGCRAESEEGPPRDTVAVDTAAAGAVTVDSPRVDEIAVVYDPTPLSVVDAMLERAGVGAEDVVVDLGSGDGRIPIRAAQKFGARSVGYEIDSALVARSRSAARDSSVADRVTFYGQDMFEADLTEATVVTLYLLPSLNAKLRPTLLSQLDPGDRIVSHRFDMGEWTPEEEVLVDGHRFYLWVVPEGEPAL